MALAVLRLLTVPVLHRLPCLQAVPGCPNRGATGEPGETYLVITYGKGGEESINFSPTFWEGMIFFGVEHSFSNWGVRFNPPSINDQLVHWWFGILGVVLSNNPFHKGFLNMQTTNPNQKLTN